MKADTDEYELPVAVADSCGELAKMLGISVQTVYNCISEHKCGYFRIEYKV